MGFIDIALKLLFVINAIFLIVIVLLQEGKGGGMGSAFGGAGGEAFGHGVGGINKFTAYTAASLMIIAIIIGIMNYGGG
jgi:preprotein translocase subunit SecG